MNNSFKFVEATDAVKIMIESKAVRSAAAVPYAEQLETDSEQSLFENQLSRSCKAVRTVDVGVMTSESSGSSHAVHSPWRGVEISSFFHHLTSTCPSVTTPQQERAGALMLPSSCLDGSVTPVGPGQNPQYTGAVQRREAVGCSQGLKMSPQNNKVSKRMTRLLRHDPTVLREEDGAVEFRISAPMFHSKFTSSPYWSIRTWPRCLQKGSGPKKRFQYCVNPYSADTISYLRSIQGHSGGKHIDPTLQDNVLLPSDFAEHIYHVGSSHDLPPSSNQD